MSMELDESKLFKYYPKDLLAKMDENLNHEIYGQFDHKHHSTVIDFKRYMKSLTGSQLPRKIDMQLRILGTFFWIL